MIPKYRAWDKLREEYREVVAMEWDNYTGKLSTVRTVDPETGHDPFDEVAEDLILEPYTGFKDKNGVDIAQGDVLEWKLGSFITRMVVRWEQEECCFELHFFKGHFGDALLTADAEKAYEVVGNIHQSYKEMLGEEDE